MNAIRICMKLPLPCCRVCSPMCWTGCGSRATIIWQKGKVVGAFCSPCGRELKFGKIPQNIKSGSNRMSGKARLRYIQDEAAIREALRK